MSCSYDLGWKQHQPALALLPFDRVGVLNCCASRAQAQINLVKPMVNESGNERPGLIHLDPDKLKRLALRKGINKSRLAELADIKRATVQNAFKGKGVFWSTAARIARALGLEDVCALLPSSQSDATVSNEDGLRIAGEWAVDEFLGPWMTASNGLQYRVCKMKHRYVAGRVGRGKCYDLLHLSDRDRKSLQAHLLRHPTVCERIGLHPHVAENLSTRPGSNEETWWVIDRWANGQLLQERIRSCTFRREQAPRLMREIALGLEALHSAQVVFRELAPSRVILCDDGSRALLTDFELAKLLDTGPTVSAEWSEDPYRAPEVESGAADGRSDIYSWARILVHVVTRQLPPKGQDADAVTNAGLPKAVWRLALDSLSPAPSDRPRNIKALLRALDRWA